MFRSSVAYSVANSLAEPEKKQNSFELDIAAIKKYLVDIANTYLLIAYRLYEVDVNKSYKGNGYKNIFEACEKELGFKKSTVYNLLRIVKIYGRDDETGDITYQALSRSGDYSYAQLVEMLSMTSIQRSLVTPDTTVKEMRKIKQAEKTKKFQTSGKIHGKPGSQSENPLAGVYCRHKCAGLSIDGCPVLSDCKTPQGVFLHFFQ